MTAMPSLSSRLTVNVLCLCVSVWGVRGQHNTIQLETECLKTGSSAGGISHCRSPSRYDTAVNTDPREFPHMALIGYGDKNSISWTCGGSLITDRFVLSAAHCAYPSPSQTAKWVRLGASASKSDDSLKSAEYEILDRILHPEYKPPSLYNDIALFVIKERVKLSEYIRPICLQTTDISSKFFISSGWLRHMREGKHKAKVSITRIQDCKQTFKPADTQGRLQNGINTDTMLCAAKPVIERENQMIAGDGVHVLVSEAPCVYRLAGVLSFGRRWGPEVYSRVSHFLPWIKTTLSNFELPKTDGQGIEKTPTRDEPCRLPEHPHLRYWRRSCDGAHCSLGPSDLVGHGQLLSVNCSDDYQLVHGQKIPHTFIIECQQGVWITGIPRCSKLCPPLTSLTLHLTCTLGVALVDCNQPALPETRVDYKCKPYHSGNFGNQVTGARCEENGRWTKDLQECTFECGISSLHSGTIVPQIVDGKVANPANFPWHAGLFKIREDNDNKWTVVCGGTLISNRVVLSAAHCVTDMNYIQQSPPLPADQFRVGLGKNHRDWDNGEASAVKLRVIRIHIPQNYVGAPLNFEQDIAVLILEKVVEVNAFVMPACVDFADSLARFIYTNGQEGYVAGWGSTEECGFNSNICTNDKSDTLMYTTTPVINFTRCFEVIQGIKQALSQGTTISRLSTDKLCASDSSRSVVQQGDSGGGLTFYFDRRHYVFGVVSIKISVKGKSNFAAFTNVQSHLQWLKNVLY